MRSKPYCNAPWLGLAYEATQGCQPCCEWKGKTFWGTQKQYIESDYLKNFKKIMYSDEPHKDCIECTHNEKIGGHSRRKYYDKFKEVDYESSGLNYIARMDFRAGNKCNMMCRMCGPQASSLLEEEEVSNGQITEHIQHLDTSDVYDLDLSQCVEISILGGEPSIDLKVRKFMNHVADNYPNIEIMVTTNATNASDKWFKTLLRFCTGPGLRIILSVDATGPTQEFQRKSSIKWNTVKKNLRKYKEISDSDEYNCGVSIQCTATAINMVTIDKWWDELLEMNIKTDLNQVWWPKGMSIEAIPDEYKDQSIEFIKDWLQQFTEPEPNDHDTKNKILSGKQAIKILTNSVYSKEVHNEFIRTQNRYDGYRNENVRDLDERFKVVMI